MPAHKLCVFSSATRDGRREVRIGGTFEFFAQLIEVEFAALDVADRRDDYAAKCRRPARLVHISMGLTAEKRLGAARAMRQHRGQIPHRAARHEHRGFLAHHLRRQPFEPIDGRVFAINIVAEFGARHRLAHLFGRQRDSVAAEIYLMGPGTHQ